MEGIDQKGKENRRKKKRKGQPVGPNLKLECMLI